MRLIYVILMIKGCTFCWDGWDRFQEEPPRQGIYWQNAHL